MGFQFPDGHKVLSDVSFDVAAGSMTGLVGRNGSGKSTLGRLMAGLLSPSEGVIEVDGYSTVGLPTEVRQKVCLVWQNPDNQLVCSVVEDDVAFGPENLGLPPAEIRGRIDEVLDLMDLNGLRKEPVNRLTAAEKQLVAVAGALAVQPTYLVLDEVTSRLSPSNGMELVKRVRKWSEVRGAGIVLVSHRMDEVALADSVIVLEAGSDGGRIDQQGSPKEVLTGEGDPESPFVPAILRIASGLRQRGLPISPNVGAVEDLVDQVCR